MRINARSSYRSYRPATWHSVGAMNRAVNDIMGGVGLILVGFLVVCALVGWFVGEVKSLARHEKEWAAYEARQTTPPAPVCRIGGTGKHPKFGPCNKS